MKRTLILCTILGSVVLILVIAFTINITSENPVVTMHNYHESLLVYEDTPTLEYSYEFTTTQLDTNLPYVTFTEAPDSLQQRGYPMIGVAYFREDDGLSLRFNIADGVSLDIAEAAIQHMASAFSRAHQAFPSHPSRIITTFSLEHDIDSANVRRRYIYHDLSMERFHGLATYLYFLQPNRYTLPAWLSSGIEDYLLESNDAEAMEKDDLILWLQSNVSTEKPLFGDAYFAGSFNFYHDSGAIRDIAYTVVRILSDDGVLWDWVRLAQTDRDAFSKQANAFFESLIGNTHEVKNNFFYHFGSIEIWTPYGMYNYIEHGYAWPWEQVNAFNRYMDASILFVRNWLEFDEPGRVTVELNPFCSQNSEFIRIFQSDADRFGEDWELYGNFGMPGIAILTNASYGLYILTHEVVHAIHLQIAEVTPVWITEGLAMAGESLFRERYFDFIDYLQVYDFYYAITLDCLHFYTLLAEGFYFLFTMGTEPTFGRTQWTYEDAGSFIVYLYRNFPAEQFLYFISNATVRNQRNLAYNIFGKPLEDIMYEWRKYLWPCGEPYGWWAYRVSDMDLWLETELCYCWERVISYDN